MNCGIYKITNLTTGHFYIGSSIELRNRRYTHFSSLKLGNHGNYKLQNDFDQYGRESFTFEILIYCDPETRLMYEQMFIDGLKPYYNIQLQVEDAEDKPWDKPFSERKTYKIPILVSPEKKLYVGIKNLKAFCREHNLHYIGMRYLTRGYRNSYKGWERL